MKKITVYSIKGEKKSEIVAPAAWNGEFSDALLAQAMHVYQDRSHKGTKSVKTRANVDITKKKIYKQKGTGGARHGAASAPIFVGGGIAHGPKPVKRELSLPQAMRQKALAAVFALKVNEGTLVAVDGLATAKKTKEAAEIIKKVLKDKKTSNILVILKEKNENAQRALRNIANVNFVHWKNANAFDIYRASHVIADADIFEKPKAATKAKKETKKK